LQAFDIEAADRDPFGGLASHKPLRCPTGKTPNHRVNLLHQKYSTLPKFGNGVCVASTRPKEEGRIAIVTNAGRAAVDVGHTGATVIAGRETVSEAHRTHDQCDLRTAKSCGPGARRLASSVAVMWRPDRARASSAARRRGQ